MCQKLKGRKKEIVEKCLFAYNIKEKLNNLEVTEAMLMEPKQQTHFENYVICKSEETRNLTYSLVSKLHAISKEDDPNFLEEYVLPVFETL